MTSLSKYHMFGLRLQELRIHAGYDSQKGLSLAMGVGQQTVSRWENGTSRPQRDQLPKLAKILCTNEAELESLAGFVPPSVSTISFDQPFPIDSLSWDSFERFCYFLIAALHPDSVVSRYGGAGHKQDGLDIEAVAKGGTITYQCKRHREFGPQKVEDTIAAHTHPSKLKIILLTRIASPDARNAINKHKDWRIWDKEDVSRQIRSLPKTEQVRLVDIFFRGQRFALLGELEAGPWMSVEDFFAGFLNKNRAFNHKWDLVGRDNELSALSKIIRDKNVKLSVITGAGGLGKSRLLYQIVSEYEDTKPGVLIKVLSQTEELSSKCLEDLGDGEKLLIVDDAHDREDLAILLNYLERPESAARAIISTRSYGLEKIKRQASALLRSENLIQLKPLTRGQSIKLASQVLVEFGGHDSVAELIADCTLECPLATVIGAFIVATEGIHPKLLSSEDVFRDQLLERFQDVITGEIAQGYDRHLLRSILKVLALIQPFNPDDIELIELLGRVEDISNADGNRLIKLLVYSGVVVRRGGMYRIAPDLLSDYIIEDSCVTVGGASSGYAEKIFAESKSYYIENILLNLGKLDWRRSSGSVASSVLLDGLWRKLRASEELRDDYSKVMTSVAFYQPERALLFAEECIHGGRYLKDLPELINGASYNFAYLKRACNCLWELSKADIVQYKSVSEDAVRVLKDLCSVRPNKPVEFIAEVVGFGISLLQDPESWGGSYTPYDFLDGVLETEGHTTSSNGLEISFSPFTVVRKIVAPLRLDVISAAVTGLHSPQLKVGISSAKFIQSAIRGPIGLFGSSVSTDVYDDWTGEFAETLQLIKVTILSKNISPLVWLELLNSISWHAQFAQGITKSIALEIFTLIPSDLEFRVARSLVYGRTEVSEDRDYASRQQEFKLFNDEVIEDLYERYERAEIIQLIAETLQEATNAKLSMHASPESLLFALMSRDYLIAETLLIAVLDNPASVILRYLQMGLTVLYMNDVEQGRLFLGNLIHSDNPEFRISIASCIGRLLEITLLGTPEITLFKSLLSSDVESEIIAASAGLRVVVPLDFASGMELIACTNVGRSEDVANAVLAIFADSYGIDFDLLDSSLLALLLDRIIALESLEGYWVQKFLANASAKFPAETFKFLQLRVERAALNNDFRYSPCPYGVFVHEPLRFMESSNASLIHFELWSWMRSHADSKSEFFYFASHLCSAILYPLKPVTISFLQDKLQGDKIDLFLVGRVMREVSHRFVLGNSDFIKNYLLAAKSHGIQVLDDATSILYAAATSGMREGMPGKPFPRDIETLNKTELLLKMLPPFSPAFRLYDQIRRDAAANIEESKKQWEMLD